VIGRWNPTKLFFPYASRAGFIDRLYRWLCCLLANLFGRSHPLGHLPLLWASPTVGVNDLIPQKANSRVPGRSMTIEEKIRQIMLTEKLSDTEKLDSLHALIPADSCKIDNLSQATRERLKQLRDGIAITRAMQELRRAELDNRG
jgi:hypothetical protein